MIEYHEPHYERLRKMFLQRAGSLRFTIYDCRQPQNMDRWIDVEDQRRASPGRTSEKPTRRKRKERSRKERILYARPDGPIFLNTPQTRPRWGDDHEQF